MKSSFFYVGDPCEFVSELGQFYLSRLAMSTIVIMSPTLSMLLLWQFTKACSAAKLLFLYRSEQSQLSGQITFQVYREECTGFESGSVFTDLGL